MVSSLPDAAAAAAATDAALCGPSGSTAPGGDDAPPLLLLLLDASANGGMAGDVDVDVAVDVVACELVPCDPKKLANDAAMRLGERMVPVAELELLRVRATCLPTIGGDVTDACFTCAARVGGDRAVLGADPVSR